MRQRMARHTPHKPFALLCVEALEDRCLLSGFTSLLGAQPPTPSENGPALLAHPHPGGAGKDSPTPGQQPEGSAAAVVQDGGASSASRVDAAQDAPGHNRTDHLTHPDRKDETKQTEHHPASDHHTSSPRADNAGQAHGNGGHKADPSGEVHSASVGHKHTTVENDHSGKRSDGSKQDDDSLAELPRDGGGDLTETDNAAEERTTAASHRGSAGTGLTVAVHDLLGQASASYWAQLGPVESAGETAGEGPFQILRELHEARAERSDSAIAVPAREAAAEESAAVAVAGQAGAAAVPHGAMIDADRQAAAFKLMFLAPANTRPGAWRWGASADWLSFAAVGDEDAPQFRVIPPAVASRPADPTGNMAEAAALPQGAGLAAGFLPADTAALEQAVRRFLDGLNTLVTRTLTENTWVRWAVIAAVAVLAAVVGCRRVQRSSRHSASAEEDESATVSWLAGSYPFRPEDG
jgi:hypothetical protein